MRRKDPHKDRSAVYFLVDPRNLKIRYVGLSTDPVSRYETHREKRYEPYDTLHDWLQELNDLSLDPVLYIAEIIPADSEHDPYERENAWIFTLKRYGCPLLNVKGHPECRSLGTATPDNVNLPDYTPKRGTPTATRSAKG